MDDSLSVSQEPEGELLESIVSFDRRTVVVAHSPGTGTVGFVAAALAEAVAAEAGPVLVVESAGSLLEVWRDRFLQIGVGATRITSRSEGRLVAEVLGRIAFPDLAGQLLVVSGGVAADLVVSGSALAQGVVVVPFDMLPRPLLSGDVGKARAVVDLVQSARVLVVMAGGLPPDVELSSFVDLIAALRVESIAVVDRRAVQRLVRLTTHVWKMSNAELELRSHLVDLIGSSERAFYMTASRAEVIDRLAHATSSVSSLEEGLVRGLDGEEVGLDSEGSNEDLTPSGPLVARDLVSMALLKFDDLEDSDPLLAALVDVVKTQLDSGMRVVVCASARRFSALTAFDTLVENLPNSVGLVTNYDLDTPGGLAPSSLPVLVATPRGLERVESDLLGRVQVWIDFPVSRKRRVARAAYAGQDPQVIVLVEEHDDREFRL